MDKSHVLTFEMRSAEVSGAEACTVVHRPATTNVQVLLHRFKTLYEEQLERLESLERRSGDREEVLRVREPPSLSVPSPQALQEAAPAAFKNITLRSNQRGVPLCRGNQNCAHVQSFCCVLISWGIYVFFLCDPRNKVRLKWHSADRWSTLSIFTPHKINKKNVPDFTKEVILCAPATIL